MNSDQQYTSQPFAPQQPLKSHKQKRQQQRYKLKVAPFLYKYFTKLEDGITIRCNLCHQNRTLLTYSIKHSIFKNPLNHLSKVHGIKNKEAVKRRIFIKSIVQADQISENDTFASRPEQFQNSKAFILRYFTKIGQDWVQCNICKMCGKEAIYSIKNSLYLPAERHLQKKHTLLPIKDLFNEKNTKDQQKTQKLASRGITSIKSQIFQYFTKIGSNQIKCNLCDDSYNEVKYSMRNQIYKNAMSHLHQKHRIKLKRRIDKQAYFTNQTTLHNGQHKIVQLACLQGIPIPVLDHEIFFKDCFQLLGLFKPEIARLTIIKAYNTQKQLLKTQLKSRCREGVKYCLSFSELVVLSRKWLVLNLHSNLEATKCIGLIKYGEEIQVDSLQAAINSKLREYDIDLMSIAATLSNGNTKILQLSHSIGKANFICLDRMLEHLMFKWLYSCQPHSDKQLTLYPEDLFQQQIDYLDDSVLQFPQEPFRDCQISKILLKICNILNVAYRHHLNSPSKPSPLHVLDRKKFRIYTKFRWHSILEMLLRFTEMEDKLKYMGTKPNQSLLTVEQRIKISELYRALKVIHDYTQSIASSAVSLVSAIGRLRQVYEQLERIEGKYALDLFGQIANLIKQLSQNSFLRLHYYLKQGSSGLLLQQKESIKHTISKLLQDKKNTEQIDFDKQQQLQSQKQVYSDQGSSLNAHTKQLQLGSRDSVEQMMACFEATGQRCQTLNQIYCSLEAIPASILQINRKTNRIQRVLMNQPQGMSSLTIQAIVILNFENSSVDGSAAGVGSGSNQ